MNWKFWNNKKKQKDKDRETIERLQEELSNVHGQLESVNEQVTKLTRMQFKSSKKTDEKLDGVVSALATQHSQQDLITENNRYKSRQDQFMQNMFRLLDELDHVSSGIKGSDQVWSELLDQWSLSIANSLKGIGVYQLDIIGKTFNPEVAESMKTVTRDSLTPHPVIPYQVVEILNRGYIAQDGRVIRKARVITIKEDDAIE